MANKLPTFDRLINPLLRALEALGGSGAVDEIYEKVIELENLPEDVLAQLHDEDKSNQTEVGYRLAASAYGARPSRSSGLMRGGLRVCNVHSGEDINVENR